MDRGLSGFMGDEAFQWEYGITEEKVREMFIRARDQRGFAETPIQIETNPLGFMAKDSNAMLVIDNDLSLGFYDRHGEPLFINLLS